MAATIVTSPVGIDVPIKKIQALFLSKIFTGYTYESHARAVMIDGVPHIVKAGNDYTELLLNDTVSGHSFFIQSGDSEFIEKDHFKTEIQIYFFINLKTHYSTITDHTASEYAKREVWQYLSGNPQGIVLKGFSDDIGNMKITDNMLPFYHFKAICDLEYQMVKSGC